MRHATPTNRRAALQACLGTMCAGTVAPRAFETAARPVAAPRALPTAHSHNDYKRERPFHQATELGFASLEVDVIPTDGRLLDAA